MKSNFSDSLKMILSKMCEIVGTTYDAIDFDNERWYIKCEWTKEEEKQFEAWLADLLYKNVTVRKEIASGNVKNKKYCEKVAHEFVWQYGWKIRE